jgi:hypothetical protein
MKFRILLLWAAALLAVGFCRPVQAQAPAAITEAVLTFNSYSAIGDHRDTVSTRWLKSDGSFIEVSRRVTRLGVDLGQQARLAGRFVYERKSATEGRITFSYTLGSPRSYCLTFDSPLEGRLVDADHGAVFGVGRFILRWARVEKVAINQSPRPISATSVQRAPGL